MATAAKFQPSAHQPVELKVVPNIYANAVSQVTRERGPRPEPVRYSESQGYRSTTDMATLSLFSRVMNAGDAMRAWDRRVRDVCREMGA